VATVSAFAQKQQITDQGNVIVKFDFFTAVWATGGRTDDRFFERDTIDTYVHETPQGQPEQEKINNHK
jgi:hypothetical protein